MPPLTARYTDSRYHFPTDFAGVLSDSNQASAEEMLTLAADVGRRLGSTDTTFVLRREGTAPYGEFDDRPDNAGTPWGLALPRSGTRARFGATSTRRSMNGVLAMFTVTGGLQVERETRAPVGRNHLELRWDRYYSRHAVRPGAYHLGYYAQGLLDLASGLALNLNARVDDNSAFGTFFTYRAGAVYRLVFGHANSRLAGAFVQGADLLRAVLRRPLRGGRLDPAARTLDQLGGRYRAGTG